MELFKNRELRGSWYFDNDKYGYDYDNAPYPEIGLDLKKLLSLLISSKLLLPRKIEGLNFELVYNNVEELIDIIKESNILNDSFEVEITGDTIIYTEKEPETYSGILSVNVFRTFQQFFGIAVYSDVWLPMAFDRMNYNFEWNLERFNLNYERFASLLKNIESEFSWKNMDLLRKDYTERGCIQIGYDLFLSEEVISREYADNPNPEFDLQAYLFKMKKAMSDIKAGKTNH